MYYKERSPYAAIVSRSKHTDTIESTIFMANVATGFFTQLPENDQTIMYGPPTVFKAEVISLDSGYTYLKPLEPRRFAMKWPAILTKTCTRLDESTGARIIVCPGPVRELTPGQHAELLLRQSQGERQI